MKRVVVGSRASHLARAMAQEILDPLRELYPEIEFKHQIVMTTGDRDRATSLRHLGGDYGGVFAKELEAALLSREIDLAVHSLKDLPTQFPVGLTVGATPKRQEIRDALCGSRLEDLKIGAKVGSGSPRRQAQILRLRPDLKMVPIRGNVPPRLNRLKGKSPLDSVLLAAAGLKRLGLEEQITELLPLDVFPPAPGQGAIGLEIRETDDELRNILQAIHDTQADACVRAERTLLHELRGGCSVPIGAYGSVTGDKLTLRAQVTALDGSRWVNEQEEGLLSQPDELGKNLAKKLIAAGVEEILEQAWASSSRRTT